MSIREKARLKMVLQPISGTPPPESAAFLLTDGRPGDGRVGEQGRGGEQGRLEGSPEFHDRCDMKTIQKTCSLFGLDPVVFILIYMNIKKMLLLIFMS